MTRGNCVVIPVQTGPLQERGEACQSHTDRCNIPLAEAIRSRDRARRGTCMVERTRAALSTACGHCRPLAHLSGRSANTRASRSPAGNMPVRHSPHEHTPHQSTLHRAPALQLHGQRTGMRLQVAGCARRRRLLRRRLRRRRLLRHRLLQNNVLGRILVRLLVRSPQIPSPRPPSPPMPRPPLSYTRGRQVAMRAHASIAPAAAVPRPRRGRCAVLLPRGVQVPRRRRGLMIRLID
jgi:hypothetical protein